MLQNEVRNVSYNYSTENNISYIFSYFYYLFNTSIISILDLGIGIQKNVKTFN